MPNLTVCHATSMGWTDAVLSRQCPKAHPVQPVGQQFGCTGARKAVAASLFVHHVSRVDSLVASEQVFRGHTSRPVTGVQYAEPSRDRPDVQLMTNPVRRLCVASMRAFTHKDSAVPPLVDISGPQPALRREFAHHVSGEPLLQWFYSRAIAALHRAVASSVSKFGCECVEPGGTIRTNQRDALPGLQAAVARTVASKPCMGRFAMKLGTTFGANHSHKCMLQVVPGPPQNALPLAPGGH